MKLRALALTSALAMTMPAFAQTPPASACFAAAEAGQAARDAGKYAEARRKFDQCSKDPCPSLVQHDCSQWLEQLAQLWPTVVLRADAAGKDVAAVKVFVDGELVTDRLDGRPMEIEPGEHTLRYESVGFPGLEEKVVATAGEKNRVVKVHFAVAEAAPPPVQARRSPVPLVLGIGFTTLAIAGFVTDAVLGGIALSEYNRMKATCAQTLPGTCSTAEVDAMQTKFLIGDIALGVGIASAVAATVFFVAAASSPKAAQSSLRAGLAPSIGGGAVFLSGSFW